MSFRARLTLFFVVIVIVPMVAVTVILFRLISDNERGKSDARVAEALRGAVGLYGDARQDAAEVIVRVAHDGRLFRELRAGRTEAATRRARRLLARDDAARIVVRREHEPDFTVGAPDAVAFASRALLGAGGTRFGTLELSTARAREYAQRVQRVTGMEAIVRRDGRTLAATLAGVDAQGLPDPDEVTDVEAGDRDFRAATFTATSPVGPPVEVSVLSDKALDQSSIGDARILAVGLLVGFLVLALGFAFVVTRSLAAQVGGFLEAARRLGRGEFDTEVPVEGRDEFAELGQEFNKMSQQLATRLAELQQERARLEDALLRIGEAFASNLDRDALLEIVTRTAVDGVGADCGRASAREGIDGPLAQRAGVGELSLAAEAIRAAEAEVLEHNAAAEATAGDTAALAYPLRASEGPDRVLGIISVARSGRPFSARERELFHYLAGQAAVSIENVELHHAVQRQAVTDELTGLFNHRRFQEVMTREVERARRFDHELGLIMLDIDNFKQVNDTYGHQQGDLVLREVARVLRQSSREIDEPARYGGEEMALALPQTDLEGAYLLAERVRERIEALELPLLEGDGSMRVTASIGVAAVPQSAYDKDDLIAAADAALYTAKRTGKNKTVRAAA